MSKKMILVGGSKGGVGKSIVSSAVIDLLRQRGEKLLVVDRIMYMVVHLFRR